MRTHVHGNSKGAFLAGTFPCAQALCCRRTGCTAMQRRALHVSRQGSRSVFIVAGFGDELLDFITGKAGFARVLYSLLHTRSVPYSSTEQGVVCKTSMGTFLLSSLAVLNGTGAQRLPPDSSFTAAGPKLRKWYGEGERGVTVAQPVRPGSAGGGEPDDAVQRTAVLVTEADSATGEQVVLQLILARHASSPVPNTCEVEV